MVSLQEEQPQPFCGWVEAIGMEAWTVVPLLLLAPILFLPGNLWIPLKLYLFGMQHWNFPPVYRHGGGGLLTKVFIWRKTLNSLPVMWQLLVSLLTAVRKKHPFPWASQCLWFLPSEMFVTKLKDHQVLQVVGWTYSGASSVSSSSSICHWGNLESCFVSRNWWRCAGLLVSSVGRTNKTSYFFSLGFFFTVGLL